MRPLAKQSWITWAALLLSFPTGYFIGINILKQVFGVDSLYDSALPLLESMGIRESLGWNINLIILAGPMVACLLTAVQVVKIKWEFTQDRIEFHFTVRKRWFPLLVAAFSLGLLAILFVYLLGEN